MKTGGMLEYQKVDTHYEAFRVEVGYGELNLTHINGGCFTPIFRGILLKIKLLA